MSEIAQIALNILRANVWPQMFGRKGGAEKKKAENLKFLLFFELILQILDDFIMKIRRLLKAVKLFFNARSRFSFFIQFLKIYLLQKTKIILKI